MQNRASIPTWKITRTYHIKANDKTHALRKIKAAIENGYDSKYLLSQRVTELIVEDVEDTKHKHPWLAEAWKQIKGKRR